LLKKANLGIKNLKIHCFEVFLPKNVAKCKVAQNNKPTFFYQSRRSKTLYLCTRKQHKQTIIIFIKQVNDSIFPLPITIFTFSNRAKFAPFK
jgi:hypothetical protein